MRAYSACPVCQSNDLAFVFELKDHSVSGETFRIAECTQCHLRMTSPVPEQNEIGKYYESDDYISHSNSNKGIINRLYQVVRNYTLGTKSNLVVSGSNKAKGKILDYGSGTGEFLATMKTKGWECTGLEPSDLARSQGIKNHGLNILPYESLLSLPDDHYDVITLWHVLEHVHELKPVFEKINKMLKSSGLLIVAVPNYQSLDAEIYKQHWAAYDVPRHLYHFSPQSMEVLFQSAGLSQMKTAWMPFDSFYVGMLSEKYRSGGMIRGVWVGFRSWLSALFNTRRCSSVIYYARKP